MRKLVIACAVAALCTVPCLGAELSLPEMDELWERAEEESLTGLFLREMQTRLEQAGENGEERALLEQAARFGLAALENGEDCCP